MEVCFKRCKHSIWPIFVTMFILQEILAGSFGVLTGKALHLGIAFVITLLVAVGCGLGCIFNSPSIRSAQKANSAKTEACGEPRTELRHCSRCNDNFYDLDHHCDVLNICITKLNYRWFALMIVCFEVHLCTTVTYFVVLIVSYRVYQVWFGFEAVACGILALLNGGLIGFHIYLRLHGLTTAEFVDRRYSRVYPENVASS